jgi:hypothetical protein
LRFSLSLYISHLYGSFADTLFILVCIQRLNGKAGLEEPWPERVQEPGQAGSRRHLRRAFGKGFPLPEARAMTAKDS